MTERERPSPTPLTGAERRAFLKRRRARARELAVLAERIALEHDDDCECDACVGIEMRARSRFDTIGSVLAVLVIAFLVVSSIRGCQPESQRIRYLERRVMELEGSR